jgi:hypothetical protein
MDILILITLDVIQHPPPLISSAQDDRPPIDQMTLLRTRQIAIEKNLGARSPIAQILMTQSSQVG